MDKLSERLEAHAKNAASRAHWAEVGGEDSDGFWKAFAADLDAAAKLARRVEEAPVGQAVGQSGPLPGYAAAIVLMEDPARIKGQRVRLVREE